MDILQRGSYGAQTGPYLRTEEGEDTAVLCNHDDERDGLPRKQAPSSALNTQVSAETQVQSQETQVLYSRENVSVYPSRKRRISGRFSLLKLNSAVFYAWLPYRQSKAGSDTALTFDESSDEVSSPSLWQYAEHPRPISHFKAIRRHVPKLGVHYIVLVLKSGLTLPPFYFGSGGVRALFTTLKQYVVLTKSLNDPSTYLVNDAEDPIQKSLAILDLSDVLMIDPCHLARLPCSPNRGSEVAETSLHGHLICRVREGVQRASQYCRDSFLQEPRPRLVEISVKGARVERGTKEKESKAETGVGLFELLDRSESESMGASLAEPCAPPLTRDEWFVFFDAAGRIVDEKGLRSRIFKAGVESQIRKEVWQYLLNLYPPNKTAAQRQALLLDQRAQYESLKSQWMTIGAKQAARFSKWRERSTRVDKDVRRIDSRHPFYAGESNPNTEILRRILLTYSIFNFDLGYCQGMSDLASPVLFVMQDEALAFWCFANLMERMEANFNDDSSTMHSQLSALRHLVEALDPELHAYFEATESLNYLFCYRWLLVQFKREFSFNETLRLWEAIWACPVTPHFHIYMCAAVLQLHKQEILSCRPCFDELLSYCVRLSGRLDLGKTMRQAEYLVKAAEDRGIDLSGTLNT